MWDAITKTKKTKKYFFNCEVFSDWKEGDPITFKGKMFLFINVEMRGQILKVIPGKFLQYNLSNTGSTSTSTVTDELTYENGQTTLSITDDVGQGDGAERRYNRSQKGWDKVLNGLKELVEEEK